MFETTMIPKHQTQNKQHWTKAPRLDVWINDSNTWNPKQATLNQWSVATRQHTQPGYWTQTVSQWPFCSPIVWKKTPKIFFRCAGLWKVSINCRKRARENHWNFSWFSGSQKKNSLYDLKGPPKKPKKFFSAARGFERFLLIVEKGRAKIIEIFLGFLEPKKKFSVWFERTVLILGTTQNIKFCRWRGAFGFLSLLKMRKGLTDFLKFFFLKLLKAQKKSTVWFEGDAQISLKKRPLSIEWDVQVLKFRRLGSGLAMLPFLFSPGKNPLTPLVFSADGFLRFRLVFLHAKPESSKTQGILRWGVVKYQDTFWDPTSRFPAFLTNTVVGVTWG
jgi:hypothetical protein